MILILIVRDRSEKDRLKRVQKIEDIKARVEELQTTVRITVDGDTGVNGSDGDSHRGGMRSNDLEARPLVKGEDGEYDDTRG